MALATFNSAVPPAIPKSAGDGRHPLITLNPPKVAWVKGSIFLGILAAVLIFGRAAPGGAQETNAAAQARAAFEQSRQGYKNHPEDAQTAWQFARAAFDLADFATNKSERAALAEQGISACRQALAKTPNSGPLHYYLGLNQGQLARTKMLGALKLVDQMESEFTRAIALDPNFDYAGAERSLGLLYRDAPALGSIGSRTKAKQHLERAVELAPQFPENRLNLIESDLKWGDRRAARRELKLLEDALPAARAQFTGPSWAASWEDWQGRLDKAGKTLEEPARLESPRH